MLARPDRTRSTAKAKAEQGYSSGRAGLNSQLHKNDSAQPAAKSPDVPYHRSTPSASSSTASASPSRVFVGMDTSEREALFSLLDEYFASRPQFASFFQGANTAATPPAARQLPPAAPVRAAAPPPPPVRQGLGTATAQYDYTGAEAEDLSFSEGDSITVTEKGAFGVARRFASAFPTGRVGKGKWLTSLLICVPLVSDDWWKGEVRGRTGLFPSSYVAMN